MRRLLLLALVAGFLLVDCRAQVLPSFGGERAGTSGFQFLKVPVDARGASLGETSVATAMDASALYWNPALAAQLEGIHVALHQASYFVDVRLAYAAATWTLPRTGFTLGMSLQSLDSGSMDVTTEFEPFGTGQQFKLTDLALGLTASQKLTDLFSYGVTAKYVREQVAGLTAETVVFDLGIFYRVGSTGASMGVAVHNFGLDGRPEGELERVIVGPNPVRLENSFEKTTPPTTFLLGFAYDLFQNSSQHKATVSAQLNNPADNAETWNMGLEYAWREILFLRSGYRFGFEEAVLPSGGFGIAVPGLPVSLRADYGFNRLERLGNVHRIGFNLGL